MTGNKNKSMLENDLRRKKERAEGNKRTATTVKRTVTAKKATTLKKKTERI